MALFSKPIKTLDDLFVHMLQDIYYAEHQITKMLPQMIGKATDQSVRNAFQIHLQETEDQIVRLDKVFGLHGSEAKAVTCEAIDGIIKEARETFSDIDDQAVMHTALIASAQAVEHYEITRYGTLAALAKQLGHADIAALLEQTLLEEKATDQKLTALAAGSINRHAAAA